MIKGVNKQILEVTNTESQYFERIIFFVRPEAQTLDGDKLHREALKISSQKNKVPKTRKSPRQIFGSLMYSVLGVGAGVATMVIINYIM